MFIWKLEVHVTGPKEEWTPSDEVNLPTGQEVKGQRS